MKILYYHNDLSTPNEKYWDHSNRADSHRCADRWWEINRQSQKKSSNAADYPDSSRERKIFMNSSSTDIAQESWKY